MVSIEILSIVLTVFYFYAVYEVNQYASRVFHFLQQPSPPALSVASLEAHRGLWRYLGIMILIMIVLYFVVIFFMVTGATTSGMGR